MTAHQCAGFLWLGFSALGGLGWFYSSRPRLFIRHFAPRDEWRDAIRNILHAPDYTRGTRIFALLHLAVGGICGLVALWLTVI